MHVVQAKGILSAHNGMNIYRGCTHGCIYCDSRSTCYQMNHSFEDIEVKENAPELLNRTLQSKRSKCMIGTGAMGDPYIHLEEQLKLTRQCLEIIEHHGFGLAIQTKSTRILRDLDILKMIHEKAKCVVQMTLTTYDEALCQIIEPNVSTTLERVQALSVFQENNIPTVVWLCPILPFINDTEENLRSILKYCFEVGVKGIICFGFGTTMREGSREYFYESLDKQFPGLKKKYQQKYNMSYECNSDNHKHLMKVFRELCDQHGVMHDINQVFAYLHAFPKLTEVEQLRLF